MFFTRFPSIYGVCIGMMLIFQLPGVSAAQTSDTVFTYQGQLQSASSPVSGSYDFKFRLYNSETGGDQVGAQVVKNAVSINDGLFSVDLDFGSVFQGQPLWLEIETRASSDDAGYTVFPRQRIHRVPGAMFAAEADMATTASMALQADMAITAQSADMAISAQSADHALNADNAELANRSTTATIALNAIQAETATTATIALNAKQADLATTSTFAESALSAVTADSATNAITAQSANQADNATNAVNAQTADHALTADSATSADSAQSADHAETADTAINAGNATTATVALNAKQADFATTATVALNGVPAGFSILSTSQTPPVGYNWTGLQTVGTASENWVELADVPELGTSWRTNGVAAGGKFYVFAPDATAVYDPATDTWNDSLASMPNAIQTDIETDSAYSSWESAFTLDVLNNKVYVKSSGEFYVYDPGTDTWSEIEAEMNVGSSIMEIVSAAIDWEIYFVSNQKTVVYDPEPDEPWMPNVYEAEAPPPSDLYLAKAAVVDGKMYVIGPNVNLKYDPTLDDGPGGATAWASIEPKPVDVESTLAVIDNKIHDFGGYDDISLKIHSIYDPVTDTWSSAMPMLHGLSVFCAVEINGNIFITGGWEYDGNEGGVTERQFGTYKYSPPGDTNVIYYFHEKSGN